MILRLLLFFEKVLAGSLQPSAPAKTSSVGRRPPAYRKISIAKLFSGTGGSRNWLNVPPIIFEHTGNDRNAIDQKIDPTP
jgi:hypothetical protein